MSTAYPAQPRAQEVQYGGIRLCLKHREKGSYSSPIDYRAKAHSHYRELQRFLIASIWFETQQAQAEHRRNEKYER